MNDDTSESEPEDHDTAAQERLAELADDFAGRHRRGEHPSVEEYAQHHPDLAAQLRELFPALLAIEQESPFEPTLEVSSPLTGEAAGGTIGRYRLLERIGEGGFGVVYMAEQQHPVRRRVALKVIKAGMDSRQVIARFEAERQALTMMEHPNIARMLDGGTTDAGRPYFVMELVKGLAITDYCDQARLTTRQRLELFVLVCGAVQHAHTKGVIHRDLKPTNVLVTLHDGVAVPKVIDFGVAKATGQQLTDRTLFTQFAQMVGTPLYMSPEQAQLSGLDVDTRSDVYGLGVLLYELLTGTTPFDKQRLRDAAYDEVRRIIREEDPPNPSTRLSSMGDRIASVSALRHTEPHKLGRLVRGELDWIVMKCLEKDRARRYGTASGLGHDVERYLCDDPVHACPASATYRLKKIVRRNKAFVAAACAVLVSLLAGLCVSTWLWREAEAARATQSHLRAKAEARVAYAQARTRLDSMTVVGNQGITDIEQSLANIDPSLIEPDLNHAAVRRSLGWRRARNGEWAEAAQHLRMLMRVGSEGEDMAVANDYLLCAPALLEAGDRAGYERLRSEAITRFAKVTNPVIAERVCKVVTLLPTDAALNAALAPFHDLAAGRAEYSYTAERGDIPDAQGWNHISRAIVAYRRGDDVAAATLAQHAMPINRTDPARMPTAMLIAAMAHHRLGRPDEARLELSFAREPIERVFREGFPTRELYRDRWFEWFNARVLLREAAGMIGEQPSALYGTSNEVQSKISEAKGLCYQAKFAEAERLMSGVPQFAIEISDRNARLIYASLGWWHLCEHRPQRAVACWEIVVHGPDDQGPLMVGHEYQQLCMAYGTLLAETGDAARYEKLVQQSSTQYVHEPDVAEMISTYCLLTPPPVQPDALATRAATAPDLDHRLTTLEALAAKSPTTGPGSGWPTAAGALFAYRTQNYGRVEQLMRRLAAAPPDSPALAARARLLLSMALHRLGRADEAEAELAKCRDEIRARYDAQLADAGPTTGIRLTSLELLRQHLDAFGNDRSNLWVDWWMNHVLLREAELSASNNRAN